MFDSIFFIFYFLLKLSLRCGWSGCVIGFAQAATFVFSFQERGQGCGWTFVGVNVCMCVLKSEGMLFTHAYSPAYTLTSYSISVTEGLSSSTTPETLAPVSIKIFLHLRGKKHSLLPSTGHCSTAEICCSFSTHAACMLFS